MYKTPAAVPVVTLVNLRTSSAAAPAATEVGPTMVTEESVAGARVMAPVPALTSLQFIVSPM